MKVIVTGGAGFIGSHIADRFYEDGFKVRIIDDLSTGNKNNCRRYELRKCSITDIESLKKAFKGADYVIHNAAKIYVAESMKNPGLYNKVNVTGTLNVLLAAREAKIKKVVFASSAAVYGASKPPLKESSSLDPLSVYAENKIKGEEYCKLFNDFLNLNAVCLRYFNVFGPRQNIKSDYAAVIPIFISNFARNKPVAIFGDGMQTRDFIYVKNVAEANLRAVKSNRANGKILNIASGKATSILQLARKISPKLRITRKAPREGDIKHSLADISQSKKVLGTYAKWSFEEGLSDTIKAYK